LPDVLTPVTALFFLVGGIFQIVASAWLGVTSWGWHMLDGLITIILGVLILRNWPASGLWVIRLFLDIDHLPWPDLASPLPLPSARLRGRPRWASPTPPFRCRTLSAVCWFAGGQSAPPRRH
jgi:hypothetical protein